MDSLPADLEHIDTECYWPSWDEPAHRANFYNFRFLRIDASLDELQPSIKLTEKASRILRGDLTEIPRDKTPLAYATVVAVSTLLDVTWLRANGVHAVSAVFDGCINFLRYTMYHFVAATNSVITPVTRQLLPMRITAWLDDATRKESSPEEFQYFVGTSARKILEPPEISLDQIAHAFSLAAPPFGGHHLNFSFIQVRNEAYLALEDRGDTRNALLGIATAAEIFLDNLLVSLIWEEGGSVENTAALFNLKKLAKRVREDYHPRIGGNWSSGVVGQWRAVVADVRNQIIHAGGLPDEVQTRMALDAVGDLVSYVFDRLADSAVQKRYPKTAVLVCGIPALQRRQAFRQDARDAAREGPDVMLADVVAFSGAVFARGA